MVSYSLARPARESLFTVVSRAEKYTAKIFLDTVVQARGGGSRCAQRGAAAGSLMGQGSRQTAAAICPLLPCLQRVGDTCAAAAFQALVPAMGFGPSGVAAACVPVCLAWTVVAYRLGLRQQRLAAAVSGAAVSL